MGCGVSKLEQRRSKSKALWVAATQGDTDKVRELLEYSEAVDVNFGNRDGEYEHSTPLHQSAYQNHTEVVQMLITAGANPNAQDSYGYTPLIWCCENRQPRMQQAASVARLLLEAGADANLAETYYGAGPLGWAAYYGKREMVALLLEFGANKDKRDFSGASALDSASANDIRTLLQSEVGTDVPVVGARADDGMPIVHAAAVTAVAGVADVTAVAVGTRCGVEPTLAAMVDGFKAQLRLSGPIVEVVATTCEQLGVDPTDKSLLDQAREAWAKLGAGAGAS